jgi:hypothetical protein
MTEDADVLADDPPRAEVLKDVLATPSATC